jgi:hypothetical protein
LINFMKKIIVTSFIAFILTSFKVNAQGGTPTNFSTGFNFLGFNAGGNNPLNIRNDFNNQIRFFTSGPGSERVRIFQNNVSPSCPTGGGMAINAAPAAPVAIPGSYLHIGTSIPLINNTSFGMMGWRRWMQLGTLSFDATDNMYVGLKQEQNSNVAGDRYDAVINWGDNINNLNLNPPPGPDYLRFIFTGSFNPGGNNATQNGAAGNLNGLEVMRVAPIGHVGIGNFYNNPLYPFRDPTRRLEILSDKAAPNLPGNPQFRITHTQQNPVNLPGTGKFTDFHTTDLGDLVFNTRDNTNVNTPTIFNRERFFGFNTNTPGNTVEINSQYATAATPNAQPATPAGAPTGWAGLRFTDLNATSIPQVNPGPGVLSVDSLGNVVYVPTDSISGFGNLCTATATPRPLTGNFLLPTATFQYKFFGQGIINNVLKQDIVSVGYSCAQIPPSRFSVLENQTTQPVSVQTYAGHFNNNNASTPVFTGIPIETAGLYAEAKQNITGFPNYVNHNIGAIHEATGSINSIGTVGRIAKSSLPINQIGPRYAIGGAFMSDTAVTNNALPSVQNIGVYASAFNSPQDNYAVYAETAPDPNGIAGSYGIFAKTVGANPSFPALGGNYAGYFDGDVVVNGNFAFTSDASLKHNFDSIPNALQLINQLKPTKFEFKTNQYPQMALAQGQQYGLVAQEVFSVMPAIVGTAKHPEIKVGSTTYPAFTYSTVEYQQLIPVLIRAVQQLSAQNQKLDSMLTALTQTVNACCSNSNARATGIQGNQPNAVSQLNIDLSDKDVIVLNQNVPNPFAEQTTITYNVPEKYGFAQLVFKTIDGKIIKTVDITKKGRGQVNVFANDLSNGLYMYSLVVDGVVVDTKKMVKQ